MPQSSDKIWNLLQLFTLREQQSKSRHSSGSVDETRTGKSGSIDGMQPDGEQQNAAQSHPKVRDLL